MPPLPVVPNVLKVVLQGNSSSVEEFPWANILHFQYSGTAPSNATCATVAGDIHTLWGTNMAPECPSTTKQNFTSVTDLTSATSGAGETLASSSGSRGDDEIPANAAMLVSYPAPMRYRGGHPRSYLLVGGNADFLDSANWSTAFTAEVQTHWQAFLNGVLAISVAGMVISSLVAVSYIDRELNPVAPYRRTTPLVMALSVASATTAQQIASQRRRIGRRRR
jgi:hypothetical protein